MPCRCLSWTFSLFLLWTLGDPKQFALGVVIDEDHFLTPFQSRFVAVQATMEQELVAARIAHADLAETRVELEARDDAPFTGELVLARRAVPADVDETRREPREDAHRDEPD